MRYSCARLLSGVLLSLLVAAPAWAVAMAWTPVGSPGNACDPQIDYRGNPMCAGTVGYAYNIGTYEVTNAQYVEFLNAKAASDPLGLYDTNMGDLSTGPFGVFGSGITRTGTSGSYSYNAIAGREDMPVNYVSFYDALRFANWMSNGQGTGDTEMGSYTLLGGTPNPSNGITVTRSSGATIVLPTEDEWYKAAYYDAVSASYFDFPTGTDTLIGCAAPTPTPNYANCGYLEGPTIVGSYTGSASPYGTFDQGGNVWEWSETIIPLSGTVENPNRGAHGGAFFQSAFSLDAASSRYDIPPSYAFGSVGFRLAMIPEPGTGLLVIGGLIVLGGRRRTQH